jgi:luciferase family oxidoreductase group 1
MLETLFPGRIDMGFGRAPGSDRVTAAALAHGPGGLPLSAYPEQVRDVLRFMTGELPEDHPFASVRAIPEGSSMPTPWLLGSAYDSARFAADQGLPFSFAHFISPDGGPQVVRAYREHFRPSALLPEPMVNVGVAALCAETDEEAHRIGLSRHLMRLRRSQGRSDGGVPSIEEALAADFTAPELDYIHYQQSLTFEGSPSRVAGGLRELAAQYGVDDLLVVTITHDYADRMRSYELLAAELGLGAIDGTVRAPSNDGVIAVPGVGLE